MEKYELRLREGGGVPHTKEDLTLQSPHGPPISHNLIKVTYSVLRIAMVLRMLLFFKCAKWVTRTAFAGKSAVTYSQFYGDRTWNMRNLLESTLGAQPTPPGTERFIWQFAAGSAKDEHPPLSPHAPSRLGNHDGECISSPNGEFEREMNESLN